MADRAYGLVRILIERNGGSMTYERKGYRYGAWIITLGEKSIVLKADGNQSFPELDRLYVPKIQKPKDWNDYVDQLVPDAELRLFALFGTSPVAEDEKKQLEQIIERTKWKFAWTYARTYPHEYTTKILCDLNDHAKLIEYIEKYGVRERFGNYFNKYFYFGERKYWHMGDPYSDDPEKQPNVINRTWLDVRRHAENVKHRWTAEEVELQKRIWEIQLEKSTDNYKSRGKE
jgi:hypothetical protein